MPPKSSTHIRPKRLKTVEVVAVGVAGASARHSPGSRPNSTGSATCSSSRASRAPMQKRMPALKAKCGRAGRIGSSRPASAKTAGSRLAAPINNPIRSPCVEDGCHRIADGVHDRHHVMRPAQPLRRHRCRHAHISAIIVTGIGSARVGRRWKCRQLSASMASIRRCDRAVTRGGSRRMVRDTKAGRPGCAARHQCACSSRTRRFPASMASETGKAAGGPPTDGAAISPLWRGRHPCAAPGSPARGSARCCAAGWAG